MPAASCSASRSADPSAASIASSALRSPRNAPSWLSACANSAISSWSALLAERARHLGWVMPRSSSFVYGPVLAEAVGQAPGDREVARLARALAQRREPARPEVDRVERQQVGGDVLARALEVVGSGSSSGGGPGSTSSRRSRSIATQRASAAISRGVGADVVGQGHGRQARRSRPGPVRSRLYPRMGAAGRRHRRSARGPERASARGRHPRRRARCSCWPAPGRARRAC